MELKIVSQKMLLLSIIFTVKNISKLNYMFTEKNTLRSNPSIIFLSGTKEQIIRQGSILEFDRFLNESRFNLANYMKLVVIEIKNYSLFMKTKVKNDNYLIVRELSSYLYKNCLTKSEKALVWDKCREITNSNIQFSSLKKLITDFRLIVWNLYLNKSITYLKVISTNSAMKKLPIYFSVQNKYIEKIMMWYSTNSWDINNKKGKKVFYQIPERFDVEINKHLIWNNSQKTFLLKKGINSSKIFPVGSILFYPPNYPSQKKNTILYFDILPYTEIKTNSFYSPENTTNAINDIVSTINQFNKENSKKIRLQVKPKRHPTRAHSNRYLDLVTHHRNSGNLEILEPNCNVYDLVDAAKLVIAFPFSSPAEIAAERGTPSSYYYRDTNEWIFEKETEGELNGIPFLRNRSDLYSWIKANFI